MAQNGDGNATPEQVAALFDNPLPRPMRYQISGRRTPVGVAVMLNMETPETQVNFITSPEEAERFGEAVIAAAQQAKAVSGGLVVAKEMPPEPRGEIL